MLVILSSKISNIWVVINGMNPLQFYPAETETIESKGEMHVATHSGLMD